jgi:DNA-binding NarL/FixJ family response regulator
VSLQRQAFTGLPFLIDLHPTPRMGIVLPTLEYVVGNKKNGIVPELTRQQWLILQLVARGLTTRQIALAVDVKFETAKWYLDRLRDKIQVRQKAGIAAWVTTHLPCSKHQKTVLNALVKRVTV